MAAGTGGKEHPLVLGQTLLSGGQPSSQLYSFRYDFQPASVQKATSGVLVLDKDSKVGRFNCILNQTGMPIKHVAFLRNS